MAKKKAAKPAAKPEPADPRPVLATRAHYREAMIRYVRRQLDCAKRGLIGSEEWFLTLDWDTDTIERYSQWSRVPVATVRLLTREYPNGDEERVWKITAGIPEHSISPREPAFGPRYDIYAEPDPAAPAVLRAVNLLAAYVMQEWLDAIEDSEATGAGEEMMPAAYFEPLKTANPDTLRKWREAGKIEGKKAHNSRDALYAVGSVLRHMRLPASTRQRLDGHWLESNIDEPTPNPESRPLNPETRLPYPETRGNSRPTSTAGRAMRQHPAHGSTTRRK